MPEARSARCTVLEAGSVAWAVTRMVNDAVTDRRLSETEAALVRDLISHTEFPEPFCMSPSHGGHERQERF